MNYHQFILKIIKAKILLIILFGLLLRLYKIKERFVFGPEQALSLWPIIKFFEEKKLTLIGLHLANYKSALFRPPFFIYLFALPLKIFNFNPLALGILFVFLGLGVIFLIYLIEKKLFNEKTALIASLIYATNFYLINADRNVWIYTPIIFFSTLIIFYLVNILMKKTFKFSFFIIGCFIGLGFSFHYQMIIYLLALILLFNKLERIKLMLFLSGVILFLSPLIIFNFRHNFIMFSGFKKLLFSQEVIIRQNASALGRINNAFKTFSDLVLSIFNLKPKVYSFIVNLLIFLVFFFLPSFYVYQYSLIKFSKKIVIFFWLSCFLSLIIFITVDQEFYVSTSFYLWFLIPLLLIIWAAFLIIVFKKNKFALLFLVVTYILYNFYSLLQQPPSDYQQKTKIVNYILNNFQGKHFSLKFINLDVLNYDYLFYYRAPFYNLSYHDISLLEQWEPGKSDSFLIRGDYDWQEDKYNIQPYKEKIELYGIKIIKKY